MANAAAAVARLEQIYARNTLFLRDRFEAYARGGRSATRVRACYPFVRITTSSHAQLDSSLAYGFVTDPGVHETSATRPDLFRNYLVEQIGLLAKNHGVPVEIGESAEPIPVHFANWRDISIEAPSHGDDPAFTRALRNVHLGLDASLKPVMPVNKCLRGVAFRESADRTKVTSDDSASIEAMIEKIKQKWPAEAIV